MRLKIYFPEQASETFEEVFASFIISQTSKGVAAVTIRNYHLHLRSISKHLDIGMPFCSLTKRHLESMVVSMRAAGLAHNTVATYLRVINTFLNWANREGLALLCFLFLEKQIYLNTHKANRNHNNSDDHDLAPGESDWLFFIR